MYFGHWRYSTIQSAQSPVKEETCCVEALEQQSVHLKSGLDGKGYLASCDHRKTTTHFHCHPKNVQGSMPTVLHFGFPLRVQGWYISILYLHCVQEHPLSMQSPIVWSHSSIPIPERWVDPTPTCFSSLVCLFLKSSFQKAMHASNLLDKMPTVHNHRAVLLCLL